MSTAIAVDEYRFVTVLVRFSNRRDFVTDIQSPAASDTHPSGPSF
jgi:hypothetical protein